MAKDDLQTIQTHQPGYIPQLRVRSNLRGGESLDACLNNVNYWKKEYDRWLKKYQNDCRVFK